jgi:hypothetical protein
VLANFSFPVTYGAGTIGWRTPGIRVLHSLAVGADKLELGIELVKNKWNNEAQNAIGGPAATVANTPATIGLGEASGLPMVQVRAKYDGKAGEIAYMAYVVGVFHKLDLNGFGDGQTAAAVAAWNTTGKTSLSGNAVEIGGKVTYNPVSFAFNAYTGKATGNMIGSMYTFGDIKDKGYWLALSGNITKELSLGLMYGANTPSRLDMRRVNGVTNVRVGSNTMGGMLKYQDGAYAIGVEAYKLNTTYSTSWTTTVDSGAMQVIATSAYFF